MTRLIRCTRRIALVTAVAAACSSPVSPDAAGARYALARIQQERVPVIMVWPDVYADSMILRLPGPDQFEIRTYLRYHGAGGKVVRETALRTGRYTRTPVGPRLGMTMDLITGTTFPDTVWWDGRETPDSLQFGVWMFARRR